MSIAAGSVVVKDISPYTLAGGNPARIIKNADNVTGYRPGAVHGLGK